MPGTTTNNGYPYPLDTDPVDAAGDIQRLAEAIDTNAMGSLLIPGLILPFGGAAAPAGFLMCDGLAVSRTTYARLFAAIGTRWGVGDNSTTFNVPNLKGRVAAGWDGSAEFVNVGYSAGTRAATMPYHNHGGVTSGSDRGLGHQHDFNNWSGDQNTGHTHFPAQGSSYDFVVQSHGLAGNMAFDLIIPGPNFITMSNATLNPGNGHVHYVSGWTGGQGAPDHLHGIPGEGSGPNNLQPYATVLYIVKY